MRYTAMLAALAATLGMSPAMATIRIAGDSGGQIGAYLDRGAAIRQSGERVVIDGPCLSACTLFLGSVRRDRICVTSRAQLGFHAAYDLGQDGGQVPNRAGTSLLMKHYPQQVRSWIARHGGLSRRMIYLSGRELAAMYPSCDAPAVEERPGAVPRTFGRTTPSRSSSADAWRQDAWHQDGGWQQDGWRQDAAHPNGRTTAYRPHRRTRPRH